MNAADDSTWRTHVALAPLLAVGAEVVCTDPMLVPFTTPTTRLRLVSPGLRMVRGPDRATVLRRDTQPDPIPKTRTFLLVQDDLSAPSIARIVRTCGRQPDMMLSARPGTPPERYIPVHPKLPGLYLLRNATSLRQKLNAIANSAADVVDALNPAAAAADAVSSVRFGKSGELALCLDPIACLRSLTEAEAHDVLFRGQAMLSRRQSLHLRIPTMGGAVPRIVLRFQPSKPASLPTCRVVGTTGRAIIEDIGTRDAPALSISLPGHHGGCVDIAVSGHRLTLASVETALAMQKSSDGDDWLSDPLEQFEDPLAAYAQ